MELREAFQSNSDLGDLRIIWVMAASQINERSRVFIDELGLADQILFLSDPKSRLIRDLGLLKQDAEKVEQGVPHPTTILLDSSGTVRFVDLRENYHFWLDPAVVLEAVTRLN